MSIRRGLCWVALGALSAACGGDDRSSSAAARTPCDSCAQVGGSGGEGGAATSELDAGGAGVGAGAGAGGQPNEADAGAAGQPDTTGVGDGGAGGETNPGAAPDGVAISEVSFWQAMRVPLELAGTEVTPIAPIITNKAGILRVFVAPGPRFKARSLSASLSFGVVPMSAPLVSTKLIRAASANGDFSTTFNFPLDPSDVVATATYSVALMDGVSGPEIDRFPLGSAAALGAVSAGNSFNVVVVPITVRGVAANISPDILATFRARLLSMYPLADVSITLHAPLASDVAVGPNSGWDQTLDALYALRAKDAPADNVYYYGMFTPTQSFSDYCVTDCTVGLSQVAAPNEIEYRGSIGLGIFADGSDSDAPDTMAHELGHALGREHAPCMTSDPGPFPYPDGHIGVWGFDSLNHLLLDPAAYGDVMGYCSPDWISDYTYDAIFARIQYVNASVSSAKILQHAPPALEFRRVLVSASGELAWGSRFTPSHAPRGEARAVALLAPGGAAIASTTGYFQPLADSAGGFLLVPTASLDRAAGVAAIRVGRAELSLDAPMP